MEHKENTAQFIVLGFPGTNAEAEELVSAMREATQDMCTLAHSGTSLPIAAISPLTIYARDSLDAALHAVATDSKEPFSPWSVGCKACRTRVSKLHRALVTACHAIQLTNEGKSREDCGCSRCRGLETAQEILRQENEQDG